MAQAYLGEIRLFAGTFAPQDWALCNGQLLAISENDALFNLLGTTYGGDGESTFALPDLQSRIPIHVGTGAGLPSYVIGQNGGVETVTLTAQQVAAHTHMLQASSAAATTRSPANAVPALADREVYNSGTTLVTGGTDALGSTGGSQPHDNIGPYLALTFIIALEGIFPSQN
jgi:microcystin-dependent protein